jgi:CsoR family transcriptional regulator, copper-sensing transcriptional repressor
MAKARGPIHRLKIAKGHLDKVITMAEDGAYCIDTIHQIQAVEAALKNAEDEILKGHLQTCVVEQIKEGKADEVVTEIMKVVKKSK